MSLPHDLVLALAPPTARRLARSTRAAWAGLQARAPLWRGLRCAIAAVHATCPGLDRTVPEAHALRVEGSKPVKITTDGAWVYRDTWQGCTVWDAEGVEDNVGLLDSLVSMRDGTLLAKGFGRRSTRWRPAPAWLRAVEPLIVKIVLRGWLEYDEELSVGLRDAALLGDGSIVGIDGGVDGGVVVHAGGQVVHRDWRQPLRLFAAGRAIVIQTESLRFLWVTYLGANFEWQSLDYPNDPPRSPTRICIDERGGRLAVMWNELAVVYDLQTRKEVWRVQFSWGVRGPVAGHARAGGVAAGTDAGVVITRGHEGAPARPAALARAARRCRARGARGRLPSPGRVPPDGHRLRPGRAHCRTWPTGARRVAAVRGGRGGIGVHVRAGNERLCRQRSLHHTQPLYTMAPTDAVITAEPAVVEAAVLAVKPQPTDRTRIAGINISIPRTAAVVRSFRDASTYSDDCMVTMAAAADRLLHHLTGHAIVATIDAGKKRTQPEHVRTAVEKTPELRRAVPGMVIVLPEKRAVKRAKTDNEEVAAESSSDDE